MACSSQVRLIEFRSEMREVDSTFDRYGYWRPCHALYTPIASQCLWVILDSAHHLHCNLDSAASMSDIRTTAPPQSFRPHHRGVVDHVAEPDMVDPRRCEYLSISRVLRAIDLHSVFVYSQDGDPMIINAREYRVHFCAQTRQRLAISCNGFTKRYLFQLHYASPNVLTGIIQVPLLPVHFLSASYQTILRPGRLLLSSPSCHCRAQLSFGAPLAASSG